MTEKTLLRVVKSDAAPRRDTLVVGEHPSVVIGDVLSRPRPKGHVIAVANEKGGVGKSTLAFHTCVALCDAGFKVAAIDLDRRQQTFERGFINREGTARRLGIAIPSPMHTVLQHQIGSMLGQEIARIGWDCDYVVIDVQGHDTPIGRRAIAMADTLVTPVNSSFVDLDLLGRFDPVTLRFRETGYFARMIGELRDERLRRRMSLLDWLVVPNRVRGGSRNQASFDSALRRLAPRAGFRVGRGLAERVAYRELFMLGLTHLDIKRIPQFAKTQLQARDEVLQLIEDLALPQRETVMPELEFQ